MYRPFISRKKSGLPILSRIEIDKIGEELVQDYAPNALIKPQEIDVDALSQNYLRLNQEYHYLSHNQTYLGMMVFHDTDKVPIYNPELGLAEFVSVKGDTIIIDSSLLEDGQERRYRFTMAHELSHGFLHKEYFAAKLTRMVHDEAQMPLVQCRVESNWANHATGKAWSDHDWLEWQANALSSAILMPKAMVLKVVKEYKNKVMHDDICSLMEVARVFHVSKDAARYRLKQLGLFQFEEEAVLTSKASHPTHPTLPRMYQLSPEDEGFIRRHEAYWSRLMDI